MNGDEKAIRSDFADLTRILIEKKLTITTMESATGGMIASLITDTEGSSAVLRQAFVTYSNEAKIREGVPAETIASFGVYSRETAEAMASAAGRACSADLAVGITGSFSNPDPANADSVPGEVHIAIDFRGVLHYFLYTVPPCPDRRTAKLLTAEKVCRELLRLLNELP